MGYYMNQTDSAFIVKRGNQEQLLDRFKELCSSDTNLKWVDKDVVLKSETLQEAMEGYMYEFTYDNKDNIVDIQFQGEYEHEGIKTGKIGSEWEIFNAIAPTVEKGSYIQMLGEDGMEWQWEFKRDKCYEKIIEKGIGFM